MPFLPFIKLAWGLLRKEIKKMAFTIAHGTPQMLWAPVSRGNNAASTSETLYVGQLVRCTNEGVTGLAQASGIGDVTIKGIGVGILSNGSSCNNVLYGVVVGTNAKRPAFDSTYNTERIAFDNPNQTAIETYVLKGGPWAQGDQEAMVKVALLDNTVTLRSPIYNSSSVVGTAPTVGTITASAGVSATTATMGVTSVASLSTMYFRTGSNAGAYRIVDSASATTHTWDSPVTNSTGSSAMNGDTVVLVNMRPNGRSRVQISNEALWIDGSAAVTTNYFYADITRLDLSVAGSEFVEFRFVPDNFISAVIS